MHSVFISYVSEDSAVALRIAEGLEAGGYETWYYERDYLPGVSYLTATGSAIEASKAMVLILSAGSLTKSQQVNAEVVRAHETGKVIIPVLLGVSWEEFRERQPAWRQALAASTAIGWEDKRADYIISRMVAGLKALNIPPQNEPQNSPQNALQQAPRQEPIPPEKTGSKETQSGTQPRESTPPVATPPPGEGEDSPVVLHISRDQCLFRYRIEQPGARYGAGASEYVIEVIEQTEQQLGKAMSKLISGSTASYRLENLGNLLYSTFLPREVQTFLRNYNGPLVLSTHVSEIPWELFYDHETGQFLGLKNAVGRRLLTSQPVKQSARKPQARSAFLLVGNPRNDLPGSAAEVNQLADVMTERGLRVELLTGDRAEYTAVSLGLQNEAYLGLHFAGHASYDSRARQYSLLLAEDGILPAADISHVLRGEPFVFLNACETDLCAQQSEGSRAAEGWRATEGLVAAFIQGGAVAVIGTRWAVTDLIAREFANRFYGFALAGVPVGEALRQTRLAMLQQFAGDNNWGAFVLYGDPLMRFDLPAAPARLPAVTAPPVTVSTTPTTPALVETRPVPATAPGGPLFLADGALNMERFEPRLRAALGGLPQEAQFLCNNIMGAPHLLIILLSIKDGDTQQSFRSAGLEPEIIRDLLRDNIRSNAPGLELPPLARDSFSQRGIAALRGAEQEALDELTATGEPVDPQAAPVLAERHLLLAIMALEEGVTAAILDAFEGARKKVISWLRKGYTEPEHPLVLADDARQVLLLGLTEAHTSGRKIIETPHFITALTLLPNGRAARALQMQSIELQALREAMHELMPPAGSLYQGSRALSRDVLSPRLLDIVSIAEVEAYNAGVEAIDELHLVTGLARVQGSMTTEVLRMMNVDFDRLLADMQAMKGVLAGRFSPAVVEALKVAQAEAFRVGYPQVHTPFVVMALGIMRGGCLDLGLREQGLDCAAIIDKLRRRLAQVGRPVRSEPVTISGHYHPLLHEKVQNILKIAEDEARGQALVSDSHVLVGVLKFEGGQTTDFLQSQGVDLKALLEFASQRARQETQ